jgi:hypothetical protein
VGTSVGYYNEKKGCGCQYKLLQGKTLLWALPLNLKKKKKNPKSSFKWGSSLI